MPAERSSERVDHVPGRPAPWNVVFWTVTAAFLSASVFFGVAVELRRSGKLVWRNAAISDGDEVDVVLIRNGDEIEVAKNGARAKVRMLGVRAFDPVINEREITAFGEASLNFLQDWILNRKVRLIFDKPSMDSRGRYLAYVELDGADINQQMIIEGVAMVYTEFRFQREQAYLTNEQLARRHVRGIWGGKKAVARIVALRRHWAISRREQTGQEPTDYLLEGVP